jgi:hypothetical protein
LLLLAAHVPLRHVCDWHDSLVMQGVPFASPGLQVWLAGSQYDIVWQAELWPVHPEPSASLAWHLDVVKSQYALETHEELLVQG